jgi:predicted ATPase
MTQSKQKKPTPKPSRGRRRGYIGRTNAHHIMLSPDWELAGMSAKNFKSIKNIIDLPLARINLIYGQNSVGKSSLLQSLLVNKRNVSDLSYDSENNKELRFSGKTFDVGSFNHMTHMHKKDSTIELGNTFRNKNDGEIEGEIKVALLFKKGEFSGINILLNNVMFNPDRWANIKKDLDFPALRVNGNLNFKFINNNNHKELKKIFSGDSRNSPGPYEKYLVAQNPVFEFKYVDTKKKIKKLAYEAIMLPPFMVDRRMRHEIYGKTNTGQWKFGSDFGLFRSSSTQKFKTDEVLNTLAQVIHETMELCERLEVVHIPPIRGIPGRSLIDMSAMNIDPSISYVYGLFNKKPDRENKNIMRRPFSYQQRIRRMNGSRNPDKITKQINQSLAYLGMNYEVSTKSGSNLGRDGVNLVLKSKELKEALAFSDVGKGISQVLPIIAAVHGERGKLILVEQPEIHLHPKLQADIADIFINDQESDQNKYIIETHSENLLLRLQSKVRNGKLSPDDVQIIYLEKNKNGDINPITIKLDHDGRMDQDFPDGFLEIGLNEVLS